jgi:hypothetical protein
MPRTEVAVTYWTVARNWMPTWRTPPTPSGTQSRLVSVPQTPCDDAGGDVLNGGPGKDGYNVDPGDTVAREPNDYWVDGEFCGGWDGHGPV